MAGNLPAALWFLPACMSFYLHHGIQVELEEILCFLTVLLHPVKCLWLHLLKCHVLFAKGTLRAAILGEQNKDTAGKWCKVSS